MPPFVTRPLYSPQLAVASEKIRIGASCFKRQFGTTPKAWSMQPPDTPDK